MSNINPAGPIKTLAEAKAIVKKWDSLKTDDDRWLYAQKHPGKIKVMIDNDQLHIEPIITRNASHETDEAIMDLFACARVFNEFGYNAIYHLCRAVGITSDFV